MMIRVVSPECHRRCLIVLALFASLNSSLCNLSQRKLTPFLEQDLPRIIGQKTNDETGSSEQFKAYALSDDSNDFINPKTTTQQIISRSGYNYEIHYVTSDDGYITQLIRIVNPLADRTKLKQPPVVLLHGGVSDSSSWIWASAIQHQPERYPRAEEDGPIKSWNRSIGFVLANNGYDVWLTSVRGSNSQNYGHKIFSKTDIIDGDDKDVRKEDLQRLAATQSTVSRPLRFWNFTMDDLVDYEIPRQLDKVLEITGAKKLNIFSFSLSTMTTLSLFSSRPEYAKLVNSYVVMAPLINNKGTNRLVGAITKLAAKIIPDEVGTILFTEILFSDQIRELIYILGQSKQLRYTLIKAIYCIVTGPSPKYNTFIESSILSDLFRKTGFVEFKHYSQQVLAGRLQRFSYGKVGNLRRYGSLEPPAYNLTHLGIGNWIVISAGNDNLATISSVNQVIDTVKSPKPKKHIHIPHYDHLDLIAGIDNDVRVNLPVLEFFNRYQLKPLNQSDSDQVLRSVKSSSGLDGWATEQIGARDFDGIIEGHSHRRLPLTESGKRGLDSSVMF